MPKKEIKIYTVSQVNALIKAALEQMLPPRMVVSGEITNWSLAASGHAYFSLKDENSLLPCVMWKSKFDKLKFQLENGTAVWATGYVDVYAPQGKYQFYVESIKPAGVGTLQQAFQQMVSKLRAEGLFEEKYKKQLPPYPERIAVLTSQAGAAFSDIRNSIFNRWPCARLFLYPVPVQGEGAAEKIADAIWDVNRRNKDLALDLLIVGRGGGSLEDLWAFNEEVLARAIFDSTIPVISAVGHEIDTTIADLVADARASTPTKAGVTAVPDMADVLHRLLQFEKRLSSKAQWRLELCEQSLQTILASSVFRKPLMLVHNAEQQADDLQTRLTDSIKHLLEKTGAKVHEIYYAILRIEPHRHLGKKILAVSNLSNRIDAAIKATINSRRMQFIAQTNRLEGLNPKTALARGYSITTNKATGRLVTRPDDIQSGDLMVTELVGENLIESKVTKKQNKRTASEHQPA
jgi:exodeoxyribonuclease VII large subunit